ncbi:transposase [Mucilaginibacter arboris]|uniref:transposase n=1 Tax=Mucilaginibacter arboris TaxID=2682090 RepID=UPI0018DD60DD|nr:transposase [Mucilaginibacter arboris]
MSSYAGYDVVQRESGTSIKGKTKISKKGNRYIRNALYFPAMVACRYNPVLKENYLRIIQKKTSKMIGQVAIQRKLLALMYTLWKNDTEFIEN